LISAGVGPSPTRREFPSEIGAENDHKYTTKFNEKAKEMHPENVKKTTTKK